MLFKKRAIVVVGLLFASLFSTPPAQAATTCISKSTNHGGYIYTAFKNAGAACTWDVPIGISAIDMLIVAGGGGGGPRHGGGGGAGGVLKVGTVSVTNIATLSITVGGGGAGGYLSGTYVEGTNGSNSIVEKWIGSGALTTRTATGGGKGSQSSPSTGGSGGGTYSGSGAAGTSGQGSAGATGGLTSGWYGGGGGGAGGVGTAGTQFGGGAGGAGTTWLSSFDTTTATRLKLTNVTGYFGGGGGGGFTSSSGAYNGGAGGVGGGGNGGGRGATTSCGVVGSKGCDGVTNTGGGGGAAGQQVSPSADSTGGAGGSGVVIFRYTITDTIELSNYGPATSCNWGVGQDYAFLINSGSGNAITKMRMQFEANAQDFAFEATRVEIWTNNSGVTGTLVGFLRPSALAASATASGASVATRVGTYIGSIPVASATQYWFVLKSGGYLLSACQAGAMVTQANSWSMVLTSSEYNMRFGGTYRTWGLSILAFELTTGTPDYLEPVVTGPLSSTDATIATSTLENATFSHLYTADEWVTWSKSGNDAAAFAFTSGGTLSLTAKNFEVASDANTDNIFEVTVTATDIGGNLSTQSLSLTIDNDNDAPVITINSGASTHSISVAENQTSVITYTATDPDSGTTLGWYFADNTFDQNKFNLNSSTGVLTFKVAPDFEVRTDTNSDNVYKVNIGVFDGAILTTQMLSVTITDVNEASAIAKPTLSGLIYKGVSTTITVVGDVPGKVQFFVNGKRIPSCKAVSTTGSAPTTTAICSWKPAVQGVHSIWAKITPTNSGLTPATSARLTVTVSKRATQR